ncbi:MAG: hypothetical protein ACXW0Q_09215 [Methylovulum sp.]
MNKRKLTSDDFPYCSFSPNQHMEKVPEKTVACWSDLLGFGSSLDAIDWNLENDESKILLRRLLHFQHQVKSRFMHNEEGLFINDAIIRTFNKSIYNEKIGGRHDLVYWLSQCLITHCLIAGREIDYGLAGIRTIICEGQILTIDEPDIIQNSNFHRFSPLPSLSTQLNTALSKCYIADSKGSKAGLKKGGVYIENSFLDNLVAKFSCNKVDNFIFLYGRPILNPVSKYIETQEDINLYGQGWNDQPFTRDCSCWLELGEIINIEHNKLKYQLIEVKSFSPHDEHALFWFDTLNGGGHGFLVNGGMITDLDGQPVGKYLSTDDAPPELLSEYIKNFTDYLNKNGHKPDLAEFYS